MGRSNPWLYKKRISISKNIIFPDYIPKELSLSEIKNLVKRFVKDNLISQGMIVDYAIHDKSQDKNGNIHCYIMTIMLPMNEKENS